VFRIPVSVPGPSGGFGIARARKNRVAITVTASHGQARTVQPDSIAPTGSTSSDSNMSGPVGNQASIGRACQFEV
jgi:hypothetical protein